MGTVKYNTVLDTVISGLSTGADEAISDTDTILEALEKLQAQIDSLRPLNLNIGYVASSASPGTPDTTLGSIFTSKGHTVTYLDDNSVTGSETSYDVIYISDTVSDTVIGTKFLSNATGIVIAESLLFDDMNMGSSPNTDTGESTLDVITSAHAIPTDLSLSGSGKSIFSSTGSIKYVSTSNLGSGATNVFSSPGQSTRSALFTYDTGSNLTTGTASGRRVGLWLISADYSKLNSSGQDLVEACLRWAYGDI